MSTATEPLVDTPDTFRFERDPAEHAEVMLSAGARFAGADKKASLAGIWLAVFIAAIVLYLSMAAYRRYVLLPQFGAPPELETMDLLFITLIPVLLLCILALIYARIVNTSRLRNLESRLRQNLAVTAKVTPAGFVMEMAGMSLTLSWAEISAMADTGQRIEFDTESFVVYLPNRCFRDEAEKRAVYAMAERFRAGSRRAEP